VLNRLRWRIYIIWLSLKWIRNINLGDWVWYQGNKYIVANGVRIGMWRLHGFKDFENSWVLRGDCKKVKSISNYYGSFKSAHRFYMTSWYGIWVREGIKDWMRSCRIWPK
jgi:hypothetical protein